MASAASTPTSSQYQSASIPVLVKSAVPQSPQCSYNSQSPACMSVRNTGTDAAVHVEEDQLPSTAAATPVEEQLPSTAVATPVAELPSVANGAESEEQLSSADTESGSQGVQSSPALSTAVILKPMSKETALVSSTDQPVTEVVEHSSDFDDHLELSHIVDASMMPGIIQPLPAVALPVDPIQAAMKQMHKGEVEREEMQEMYEAAERIMSKCDMPPRRCDFASRRRV
ncbi:hypothetical protein V6N11_020811 [Hibiscus sabdariffa]|uniref:Uncharacterized protein n=1 Tax=Hibiscus sabdariffa TaxID=183260 RepID=A0ABR2Q9J5_9ROSI